MLSLIESIQLRLNERNLYSSQQRVHLEIRTLRGRNMGQCVCSAKAVGNRNVSGIMPH